MQHQKQLERLDSFRDRFGTDWLQYKRHLEECSQGDPVVPLSHSANDEVPGSPAGTDSLSGSTAQGLETPLGSLRDASLPLDSAGQALELPLERSPGDQRAELEADELVLREEEEEKPEGNWVLFGEAHQPLCVWLSPSRPWVAAQHKNSVLGAPHTSSPPLFSRMGHGAVPQG